VYGRDFHGGLLRAARYWNLAVSKTAARRSEDFDLCCAWRIVAIKMSYSSSRSSLPSRRQRFGRRRQRHEAIRKSPFMRRLCLTLPITVPKRN